MKKPERRLNQRSLIIVSVAVFALASLPLSLGARSVSTSVKVVNNSSRSIRNIYLSHVDSDDWSGNQLDSGSTLAAGAQVLLDNLPCDAQQGKLIAEDENGCFLSTAITCGENSTWTITDNLPRDCGY